jgi:hypothetical protein
VFSVLEPPGEGSPAWAWNVSTSDLQPAPLFEAHSRLLQFSARP